MFITLQTPSPQTLYLSAGDQHSIISGQMASVVGTTVNLQLSIVADPNLSISLDGVNFSSAVQWTESMTATTQGYSTNVIFHMNNNPGGTTPCGLQLTADTKSDGSSTTYSHIIYI